MPGQNEQSKPAAVIEADLRQLAAEVARHKELMSDQGLQLSDREIIRHALESFGGETNREQQWEPRPGAAVERERTSPVSTVADATLNSDDSGAASTATDSGKRVITDVLPDYVAGATAPTKLEIEYLLEEAFSKGVEHATAMARSSNPFILDAFRDALAGKLYDELKKQRLVDT